ncbi:MAG: C4-type zinc ribbon domain-containing protein [Candidatus Tectomicrobia bacterium]|nr:C4-type zinc ribbon domain-containing protein [Candidatus Tectomicrobia bacterium]
MICQAEQDCIPCIAVRSPEHEVEAVRDQLRFLADLQLLDNRLHTLSDKQNQLPQLLQHYEQACAEAQDLLASDHANIEEAERQRRSLERRLEDDQAQLVKTQNRLHEIKTNREYSAVLAEIDGSKQRISEIEDQVLDLMEETEQLRQAVQAHEQHMQEATRELERQMEKIETAQQEVTQQMDQCGAERQQVLTHLDADLVAAYEKVASRNGGLGAVLLADDSCGGCHLRIRPQLISDVRKQETIVTCPHCRRILLWPA